MRRTVKVGDVIRCKRFVLSEGGIGPSDTRDGIVYRVGFGSSMEDWSRAAAHFLVVDVREMDDGRYLQAFASRLRPDGSYDALGQRIYFCQNLDAGRPSTQPDVFKPSVITLVGSMELKPILTFVRRRGDLALAHP